MVTIEFLEKEYNELVNNVKKYIQERLSSDVKIMKPYDKMRAELYDTLTVAKAKIEQMQHSDLVALIDFSNKLNTLVETRAKESCCDYVFGERSY